MKPVLLYLRIINRIQPDLPVAYSYSDGERRFLATYKKFKPTIPHDLLVVNCGEAPHSDPFDDVVTHYTYYDGWGSDCGAFQQIGGRLDCNLVVCFNTLAYFWRNGWLEPFVDAARRYGPGVYGPTASFENHPHLRTPCIAFHPNVMRQYPREIRTREDAYAFESGPDNFSLWAEQAKYAVRLVTAGECFKRSDWRKPANIFRRGDQTNCLVWDRHTLLWQEANPIERAELSKAADG